MIYVLKNVSSGSPSFLFKSLIVSISLWVATSIAAGAEAPHDRFSVAYPLFPDDDVEWYSEPERSFRVELTAPGILMIEASAENADLRLFDEEGLAAPALRHSASGRLFQIAEPGVRYVLLTGKPGAPAGWSRLRTSFFLRRPLFSTRLGDVTKEIEEWDDDDMSSPAAEPSPTEPTQPAPVEDPKSSPGSWSTGVLSISVEDEGILEIEGCGLVGWLSEAAKTEAETVLDVLGPDRAVVAPVRPGAYRLRWYAARGACPRLGNDVAVSLYTRTGD